MKKMLVMVAVLTTTLLGFAQERHMQITTRGGGPETMPPMAPMPPLRPGGAWWKDSEVATKLKLSDQQKQKLEQTFLDYRLKLVDLHADVERAELRLQPLMDADQINKQQISTALDTLIDARAKLEKTSALMNVSMREILTTDQWKQLRDMQRQRFKVNFHREPDGRGEKGTRIRIEGPTEGPGAPEPPPPPPGEDNQ